MKMNFTNGGAKKLAIEKGKSLFRSKGETLFPTLVWAECQADDAFYPIRVALDPFFALHDPAHIIYNLVIQSRQ
jgi:hypothetical protein